MDALVAVTYRCNAKCRMCNIWKHPTEPGDEIDPDVLEKLPERLNFANITGGEPMLRDDMGEIADVLCRKAARTVISTNGYHTDRIEDLAKERRDLGFRISIEGLPAANDELRGIRDGFDHGLRSLLRLRELGIKDIGFGITVSDRNIKDLMELYSLAEWMGLEFATAVVHNNFYFQKEDNVINEKEAACKEFERLIKAMLGSKSPKKWFRAYFNYGLVNRMMGGRRLLPCDAGNSLFFVEPSGEVHPCNAMKDSIGNLKEKDFGSIWDSAEAKRIRGKVRSCAENCWMVGTAAPAMKKDLAVPVKWIIDSKIKLLIGKWRLLKDIGK